MQPSGEKTARSSHLSLSVHWLAFSLVKLDVQGEHTPNRLLAAVSRFLHRATLAPPRTTVHIPETVFDWLVVPIDGSMHGIALSALAPMALGHRH